LSGKETALFTSSQENLAHPVLIGDSLFFNSGVTGIDNVYLFRLDKQTRYQVTNRKLGGFNPAISQDGKELIFNDFTKNGHRLAYMPLHDSDLKEVNPVSTTRYFGEMMLKEAHQNLLKQVPNQTLRSASIVNSTSSISIRGVL
jgi:tricorn protease-like protein